MKKVFLLPVVLLLFFSCNDEVAEPNELCTTFVLQSETCTRCFENESQKEQWFEKCMPNQNSTCSQLLFCE